jgi:hypothetical protein
VLICGGTQDGSAVSGCDDGEALRSCPGTVRAALLLTPHASQNLSLSITKMAFERCIKGSPSSELTNKEQSCVRDVAHAYTSAQQILNQAGGTH